MLNTGLQLHCEIQQKEKASSYPTTNIQHNSQRKTKQLANEIALFINGLSSLFPPPQSPTSAHLDWTRAFTTPLSSFLGWSQSPGFGRMGSSRHQVLREHKPVFRRRASPNTDTTARSTNCCYLDWVLTSYRLDFDKQGKSLLQNFLAIWRLQLWYV